MALYLGMDPVHDKDLMWIAACAMREPPTPGWDEVVAADGKTYFVNRHTGESAWRLPSDEKYRQMYERKRTPVPEPEVTTKVQPRRRSASVFSSLHPAKGPPSADAPPAARAEAAEAPDRKSQATAPEHSKRASSGAASARDSSRGSKSVAGTGARAASARGSRPGANKQDSSNYWE